MFNSPHIRIIPLCNEKSMQDQGYRSLINYPVERLSGRHELFLVGEDPDYFY